MTTLENIVYALQAEMTTPTAYGWFHLLALALTIALAACFITRLHHAEEKQVRRLLLIFWLLMVATEIYKQIIFALSCDGVTAIWDYAWYAFPFQLCSTPLYVLPFAALLPEGKVRNACLCYLSTFSLFGGLAVMLYPNDVFINFIGINIQTMLHHGSQVVLGIFLAVRNHRRLSREYYFGALSVFGVLAAVAMAANVAVYHLLRAGGMDDTFNMFFISPYFDCTLPILSSIYPAVPYPAFLLIYLLGFAAIAAIMFFGMRALLPFFTGRKKYAEE